MYVYQNGKLYFQLDSNKCIGVEIYPDKIIKLEGTETVIDKGNCQYFDKYEVVRKWHILSGESYIFPREPEPPKDTEVKVNEPANKVKKSTRKSTAK